MAHVTEHPVAAPPPLGVVSNEVDATGVVRGLFGRDSVYLLLWGVQLIMASLLTPITTRLLGQSRYGHASAAFAVMQVLFPIAGLSLAPAVQRAFSEPGGEERGRSLVALSIVTSVVVCAIALATGRAWAPAIGFHGFPVAVQYAVIWAGLCGVTFAGLGYVQSQDRLGWFAAISLTQSIVAEAVALGFVYSHRTAGAYLFGQMVCQGVAVLIMFAAVRPRTPRRHELPLIRSAVAYSSSLIPAALAGFVFDASDRFIIQSDLGPSAVGRYAVARNIGGLSVILLGILNGVWMPRLYAIRDPTLRRDVLAASRDGIYRLLPAMVIALVLASPVILWIMAPPSYHTDGLFLITALIAMSALPAAGGQSAIRVLMLSNRTPVIAAATLVAAAANLILNLLLVPRLGIDGAALVSLGAYGLQFVLLELGARRSIRLPRPSSRVIAWVALAMAVCLGSTLVQPSAVTIGLRLLFATAAIATFLVGILDLVAPHRLEPLRRRLRAAGRAIDHLRHQPGAHGRR